MGMIFLLTTLLFNLMPNFPRIPGDIYLDKGGFKIYIPWLSSIIISVVLTIVLDMLIK